MGCHFHDYVIKDTDFHLCCISLHSLSSFSLPSPSLSVSLPLYWITPLGEAICQVWAAPWRGPLGEELKSDNSHMSGSGSSSPSQAFKLQPEPKLCNLMGTTQLSHSQILEFQQLCKIINICCFKVMFSSDLFIYSNKYELTSRRYPYL